ncbi:hypothetical protein HK101_000623 [Irineochytrium annulatum]|nr:hypothetical protein HK101_000623 [Irineochytrium annulatum]
MANPQTSLSTPVRPTRSSKSRPSASSSSSTATVKRVTFDASVSDHEFSDGDAAEQLQPQPKPYLAPAAALKRYKNRGWTSRRAEVNYDDVIATLHHSQVPPPYELERERDGETKEAEGKTLKIEAKTLLAEEVKDKEAGAFTTREELVRALREEDAKNLLAFTEVIDCEREDFRLSPEFDRLLC